MITAEQIAQFLQRGAVTIDTPLTEDQLRGASQVMDRLLPQRDPPRPRVGLTCSYYDEELLELIQHPFFEEVAKRVLDSPAVKLLQTAIIISYPQPGSAPGFDQHIDMQYTRSDLEATPRRAVCSFFLWLTDVTEDRAPMMMRPGSHWPLIEAWENDPALRGKIPRVEGVTMSDLPVTDFAEAEPVLAKAGQVSVLTTGMVHGASVHTGDKPRKAMVITFNDASVTIGLPEKQQQTKQDYDRGLLTRLRPDRLHLVNRHAEGE